MLIISARDSENNWLKKKAKRQKKTKTRKPRKEQGGT